ncbi:MAG: SLC13 family permease [Actinobacteria bacterium]|nr:SLC13 family permease [Actinomycetota bacterium]
MTLDMGIVLGILAVAVVLFVTEWVRLDVVALAVLAALAVTGQVSADQALSGFSSPAVVTIWGVFILSGGLAHTGIASTIGRWVIRFGGDGEVRLVTVVMLTGAAMSAFMNNVGVAALLLPVVMEVARRTGRAPSRLLLPLAFGTLLGGMTTLIGRAPNLVISASLEGATGEPFSMFDFARIGLPLVVAGVAFMVLAGRRLLPERDPVRESQRADLPRLYRLFADLSFVHVPAASSLDGVTLHDARLGAALGIDVIGIFREGGTEWAPGPGSVLRSGDRLLVRGALDRLWELRGTEYLSVADDDLPVERLVSADIEIAEIPCRPRCPFVGRTLRELDFRNVHGVIVLAIRSGNATIRTDLETRRLQAGDRLLVQGTAEQLADLSAQPDVEVRRVDRADAYRLEERLTAVTIPPGSALAGQSLAESRLGEDFGLGVMGIVRGGDTTLMPGPGTRMRVGDTLLVKGRRETLAGVEGLRGLEVDETATADTGALESDDYGMAEVVLSPRTGLAGRTLRDLRFRERHGLMVMAISREGEILRAGLRDLPLRFGDALLLYGPRRRLEALAEEADFLVLTAEAHPPVDRMRAPVATAIMTAFVASVLFGWLAVPVAAVAGAVLMVVTGCLSMDQAYRSIEWPAVFLIAGMLPMGIALQESGAVAWITERTLAAIGDGSPLLVVAGLYLVTALSAQVIPTLATAILMAPIALHLADGLGLSPQALLMTVAVAATTSFMTPIGSPVNVLVMGPGGYRFRDYVRVGLPLTLVCMVITLVLIPVAWPLQG